MTLLWPPALLWSDVLRSALAITIFQASWTSTPSPLLLPASGFRTDWDGVTVSGVTPWEPSLAVHACLVGVFLFTMFRKPGKPPFQVEGASRNNSFVLRWQGHRTLLDTVVWEALELGVIFHMRFGCL